MERQAGSNKSAERFPEPYGDWIALKEFADVARVCQKTARRRTRPGYPGFVVSAKVRLPDGRQIILINPRSMTFDEQQRLKRTGPRESAHQEAGAAENNPRKPPAASCRGTQERQLSLYLRTEVDDAIEQARKRLPPSQHRVAIQRYRAIQPILDHDFKAQGFERKGDFERLKARELGVSQRHLQRWRKEFKEVLSTADLTEAFIALADERPGPERGTVTIDSSMKSFLWDCWVLKKWTRKQCCRALRHYLEEKQRGCGARWAYEIPSDSTICRLINAPEPYGLGGDRNPLPGSPKAHKANRANCR